MSNSKDGKLQIEVKARKVGNSIVMTIPGQHVKRLNIDPGDTMKIQAEHGKYGKYFSAWNHDKQSEDE